MSKETDDWVINLGKAIKAEEDQLNKIDEEKVRQVEIVRMELSKVISGVGINITSEIHSPSKSMGYVRISGSKIIISDYEVFSKACDAVSVIDVYPKTDGRIVIDVTFHGLAKRS